MKPKRNETEKLSTIIMEENRSPGQDRPTLTVNRLSKERRSSQESVDLSQKTGRSSSEGGTEKGTRTSGKMARLSPERAQAELKKANTLKNEINKKISAVSSQAGSAVGRNVNRDVLRLVKEAYALANDN